MLRCKVTQFVYRILLVLALYILYDILVRECSLLPILSSHPIAIVLFTFLLFTIICTTLLPLSFDCLYERDKLTRREKVSTQRVYFQDIVRTPNKDEKDSVYQFFVNSKGNKLVLTEIPVSLTTVCLTDSEPYLTTYLSTYRLRKEYQFKDSYLTHKTQTITTYTLHLNRAQLENSPLPPQLIKSIQPPAP